MSAREEVRARLAAEGIECSEDELSELVAGFAGARAAADRLHAVDCGDLPPFTPLDGNGPSHGR